MIELRWLYDSRSDAHRVLQYRVWEKGVLRNITINNTQSGNWGFGEPLPEGSWSEWRDVPEVNAAPLSSQFAAPHEPKETK